MFNGLLASYSNFWQCFFIATQWPTILPFYFNPVLQHSISDLKIETPQIFLTEHRLPSYMTPWGVFTVTLSRAATSPVTVRFATANGTAVAGPARDYMATRGMLTFAPGQTSRTITVTVRDDTLVEADETFFVNLSQASGATIAAGRATGTILDDDRVSVANWAAFAGLASSPGAAGGKQRPFAAG